MQISKQEAQAIAVQLEDYCDKFDPDHFYNQDIWADLILDIPGYDAGATEVLDLRYYATTFVAGGWVFFSPGAGETEWSVYPYEPPTGTLVGIVTDDTPKSLEYGDYRGYVEIDAETGECLRNLDAAQYSRLTLGERMYSEWYDDLRPVLK